jgi:hypothetical protein
MSKKTKEEIILDKIKKMYRNYGIDIFSMDEEEIDRIFSYYINNSSKIDEDLKKSEPSSELFDDDNLI